MGNHACFCTIVPPHMVDALAQADDPELREMGLQTQELSHQQRQQRVQTVPAAPTVAAMEAATDRPDRTVFDARQGSDLPGNRIRGEQDPPSADPADNQAYDSLGATFTFYYEVFQRRSIDNAGLPLNATVHYGQNFNNAFWNGEQMVFGDGDRRTLQNFTGCLDVIAHELTHGVTQYSGGLDYEGQAGALNESISDVFGSLAKQYALRQTADQADWLIGAGVLGPGIKGVALRSMKEPGTAYNDPLFGKDPQPAVMAHYVNTERDHGGVHINSGIPNYAFYLVADALGGFAWEKAGRIWYQTLTSGSLPSSADFATFAHATTECAHSLFGAGAEEDAVRKAWAQVGVNNNG
ncbi:Zn-dependent metalloprotease [Streptomyces olivoverticillatus]|uniref:Neutral metalloproteinase n=1 Tax=Streptomyces olivoverticillatus TaxID=66427 RepID=A0A7W7LL77_9ACTN|nr:M4 family metallopeptidase [Streptomyces olivoverticillatus]MBB4891733.1 Zn-dependent metalloprotease [Streptomyces olivoverticillatus]